MDGFLFTCRLMSPPIRKQTPNTAAKAANDMNTYFVFLHSVRKASVKKILKLFAPARMTELTQSLSFDLADTFTGDIEYLADLLKCA